jgi:DHA2 family multidrug resistance protein
MTWTLTAPLRRARIARRAEVAGRVAPTLPSPASGGGLGRGRDGWGDKTSLQGVDATPTLRDWFGVLAMVFGLFMAIMDVQIVTSSLTQIQGGLSASIDEISWVQTAYLIADVVMVPLSGTLSRLLSTRVLFVTAALGFTGASALCATATSLGQMIVFRAMQGFSGGAMMPLVFPVIYTKFRMPQLATVMVLISLILNLSSTLGPTIGGYLTDTFSWHWLFLVNIVPGIAVAVTVWLLIDIDKPELSLLRHFDLTGLVLMALFLGCLQYALQEGPRWDWFSDNTIFAAVVVSSIASAFFFWRVLTYHQPIVDLRVFTNRNFTLGSFYTFVVGTGMYGTTYLVPLFLAQVRGFSSLQIGETVVVTGLAQLAMSPISPLLARKMDLRLMLSIGIGLFAVAMYLTAGLTNQAGFVELLVPQVLRGMALMMCYIPANLIALSSVPQDKLKNAAGLYNLTRDLGGAIALATIGTVMNNRLHFHWNRLIEDINPARPAVQHFLDMQAGRLDPLVPGDTGRAAVKLLANLVQREALVLTYNDAIMLLGSLFVAALFLMPLVRRPRATPVSPGH